MSILCQYVIIHSIYNLKNWQELNWLKQIDWMFLLPCLGQLKINLKSLRPNTQILFKKRKKEKQLKLLKIMLILIYWLNNYVSKLFFSDGSFLFLFVKLYLNRSNPQCLMLCDLWFVVAPTDCASFPNLKDEGDL